MSARDGAGAGDVAFDGNGELGEVGVANDATELAAHREALLAVLGPERYAHVFERFLEEFFTADDARFIASLGFSLARIPVNYRHLEDDTAPFEIRPDGFRHLDRAIELTWTSRRAPLPLRANCSGDCGITAAAQSRVEGSAPPIARTGPAAGSPRPSRSLMRGTAR